MTPELKAAIKDFCETECIDKTACWTTRCDIYVTMQVNARHTKSAQPIITMESNS